MANWALVVGINSYQRLRSLRYAERDAQLMRDYFENEAGFEQVFYFADNSKAIEAPDGSLQETQPIYANLISFLHDFFEYDEEREKPPLAAGDNLWFFFSGHGIRYLGEDYLVPSNGNPRLVRETNIALSYVTQRLRRSGADNVMLLLDACRNENELGSKGVGIEKQQGVITIASCSPQQESYEIEEIGQGSFTYALLEALRIQGEGNCATVERLYQHLRYRVAEINASYEKPVQTPYAIVEPASKYHLILLPKQATDQDIATLKNDAYRAETRGDLRLAEKIWIRINALPSSPSDPEVLESLKRIWSSPVLKNKEEQQKLELYRQEFLKAVKVSYPLDRYVRNRLKAFQESLELRDEDVKRIEKPIIDKEEAEHTESVIEPRPTNADGIILQVFKFEVVKVNNQGQDFKREQGQAEYFKEDLGKAVELDMVYIPGEKFLMGTEDLEIERLCQEFDEQKFRRERPQHEVTVQPFFMGRYPITQAQWREVANLKSVERELDPAPSNFKQNDERWTRPVEQISWGDAQEFCARLSKKSKKKYRLPTEAEWEYACRAGTSTSFHFGETITGELANYCASRTYAHEPKGEYRQETRPVGSFSPNAFGLYDMHGQVWEWCEDDYHKSYHDVDVPTDGGGLLSKNSHIPKVLRGGSWSTLPWRCRSAYRYFAQVSRNYNIGFRVVCVVPRTP